MLTNLDALNDLAARPPEETGRARKTRRPQTDAPATLVLPTTPSRAQRLYAPLRRAGDVLATLLLALIAVPVIALAALAVKITSRGPAFYTQIRTGKDGKPFTIYKLRSMIDNCESLTGPRWTIPGDPRVTPVGWLLRRTHIDELPQLLNVLRGEMSLVGPRPERPEFVQELERMIPGYQTRHAVLPGITGLAQVQLPPDTDVASVRRKLLYDLYFVRHCSPLLDLRIALCTGLHLLGVPCTALRRLRLVPGGAVVEDVAESVAAEPNASRLRKQAAA